MVLCSQFQCLREFRCQAEVLGKLAGTLSNIVLVVVQKNGTSQHQLLSDIGTFNRLFVVGHVGVPGDNFLTVLSLGSKFRNNHLLLTVRALSIEQLRYLFGREAQVFPEVFFTVRALLVHVELDALGEGHSLQLVLLRRQLTLSHGNALVRERNTARVKKQNVTGSQRLTALFPMVSILPQGNFTLTVKELTRLHTVLILVVQNLLENLQIRGEGFLVARSEVAGLENLHGGRRVARQVIAHDNTTHCGFCVQGVVQPQVKVRLIIGVLVGTREFQQIRPFRALVEQTLRGGLHRRVLHHCGGVHRRVLSTVERFEPTIRIAQIDRLVGRRVLLHQVTARGLNNDDLGICTVAQTVNTSEALCQGGSRR